MRVWQTAGPPIIEVFPDTHVRVDINDILNLECQASGRPEPTVTWTRTVRPAAFSI